MSWSPQQLVLKLCQPHYQSMPPLRSSLLPQYLSTWSSPTTLPSRSVINSWWRTQRRYRKTSAEGKQDNLGSSFCPSNTLVSPTPHSSAHPTWEERQPSQNGRRPGMRSASSENTRRRDADTRSPVWSTPLWRTRSSPPLMTPTYPRWKMSTQVTPQRWWWS